MKNFVLLYEVSLHWLRHRYATPLLDSGTDIMFIREFWAQEQQDNSDLPSCYDKEFTENPQSI